MRAGYEKGYNGELHFIDFMITERFEFLIIYFSFIYLVVTLTDCTATTSQEAQTAALSFTYPMFSRPMVSSQFLPMLS
jgi:hypothetical protein